MDEHERNRTHTFVDQSDLSYFNSQPAPKSQKEKNIKADKQMKLKVIEPITP